jgi:hypothetical protein
MSSAIVLEKQLSGIMIITIKPLNTGEDTPFKYYNCD